MNSNDLVISTEGLSKSFGDVQVLKSLSLRVPQKSIFAFLGPNASGKTTTIKLWLGLLKPTRGRGKIFGKDIIRDQEITRDENNFQDNYLLDIWTAGYSARFDCS